MRTKKLLSLLFAALLLATGCGQTASETETSGTAETTPVDTVATETELQDNLPAMDMEGYTYRAWISGNEERKGQAYTEELNGEIINDAIYNKIITVEERFNCDVVDDESADPGDSIAAAKNSIMAGDDAFDLMQGHDISMASAALEKLFHNLYEMPHFDMSKPWWPSETVESMTVADQMYMMINNISCHSLAATRILFFNKDLMTDLGMEYPYDMVREGTWTMDAMLKMVEQGYVDVNGNGMADIDDQLGYISDNHFYAVMEPFQLEPYKKDENGNLYYDLDVDRMMTLTEKFYNLLFGTGGLMNENTDNINDIIFTEGRALFRYCGFSNAITQFSHGDVVYGALPMPKLDENQEQYNGGATDRPFAIPITVSENLEKVAIITEALNIEGYKQVFPAYYETAMKSRYADGNDDAEMIELIHDNVIISFTYLYGNYASAYNIMFENLFCSGTPSTDVASWAAKNESAQTKRVEDIQKFYDENRK